METMRSGAALVLAGALLFVLALAFDGVTEWAGPFRLLGALAGIVGVVLLIRGLVSRPERD